MIEGNILYDCKQLLDPMLAEDSGDFNNQLVSIVEATILPLTQLGCIKPLESRITSETKWQEIINPPKSPFDNYNTYSAIATYVKYNVRIIFDPPVSNVLEIYKEAIREAFFRIEVAYELQGE